MIHIMQSRSEASVHDMGSNHLPIQYPSKAAVIRPKCFDKDIFYLFKYTCVFVLMEFCTVGMINVWKYLAFVSVLFQCPRNAKF